MRNYAVKGGGRDKSLSGGQLETKRGEHCGLIFLYQSVVAAILSAYSISWQFLYSIRCESPFPAQIFPGQSKDDPRLWQERPIVWLLKFENPFPAQIECKNLKDQSIAITGFKDKFWSTKISQSGPLPPMFLMLTTTTKVLKSIHRGSLKTKSVT